MYFVKFLQGYSLKTFLKLNFPLNPIFILSFKIIHFNPFLFQKQIFIHVKKTCIQLLCPLTASGWVGGGVKAFADASAKIQVFI